MQKSVMLIPLSLPVPSCPPINDSFRLYRKLRFRRDGWFSSRLCWDDALLELLGDVFLVEVEADEDLTAEKKTKKRE